MAGAATAPKLISPLSSQGQKRLRVAAYCRVSSSSADQLNSYAVQIEYYTEYIRKKTGWELVEIFADEGISGTGTDKRDEFQRMIRMCELRQIDLIITKSVSRFARNVRDTLGHVRKLKHLGIGVIFEKEGIDTRALGDEMLLNTFAAIAQEESQSISQNVRLANIKRMERGEYVASNAPYGFRLVDKQLVAYEPEAEVVRWIFAAYLNGMSTAEIAKELTARGTPTKCGRERWMQPTVLYILTNERYIGDSLYQKTFRTDAVPFRQHMNRGQRDMYYATDTHTGIVEKDVYENVQALIRRHSVWVRRSLP